MRLGLNCYDKLHNGFEALLGVWKMNDVELYQSYPDIYNRVVAR